MKWTRTLKWLIAILMMQMKDRTSLMRNRKALSLLVFLGRSYPDSYFLMNNVTFKTFREAFLMERRDWRWWWDIRDFMLGNQDSGYGSSK